MEAGAITADVRPISQFSNGTIILKCVSLQLTEVVKQHTIIINLQMNVNGLQNRYARVQYNYKTACQLFEHKYTPMNNL